MKKTIVPRGSKIDIENTFSKVQDSSEANRFDLIDLLIDTYGVIFSGTEDHSLEITKVSGQNKVEVAPGYGLTESGKLIKVLDTDPAEDKRMDTAGYSGPIYIENLEKTKDPTQILDGFAWLASGEQHRDTTQYDYYQLTKDDPGVDGIYLAYLESNGDITDKRADNRLHIKPEITHAQNTDIGTTATTFKVGIGTLGSSGEGLRVILEEDTPSDVLNLRITDVSSVTDYEKGTGNSVNMTRGASDRIASELDVTLEWGYDNITGRGTLFTQSAINEWYIDKSVATFTENELKGSYLYLPSTTDNLIITGNDATGTYATKIYVTNVDGTDWDGTSVTVDSSNPGFIHSNADRYIVRDYPKTVLFWGLGNGIDHIVESELADIGNKIVLRLKTGSLHKFKVQAARGKSKSNWVTMPSGSYEKYGNTQNYDTEFNVIPPQIDSSGAAVAAHTSTNGFVINITGWDDADIYEAVYTTDNAGADFNNPEHDIKLSNGKTKAIYVTSNVAADYTYKVRPLIGGYQVATPLPSTTTKVTSGAMGVGRRDEVVTSNYFVHETYDINIDSVSSLPTFFLLSISGVKFPSNSGQSVANVSGNAVGEIIEDSSGNEYVINFVTSDNKLGVKAIKGTSATPSTGSATIGVSKRARRIYKMNHVTKDYRLIRLDVDCDSITGEDITLRVYQEGKESEADTILINSSDSQFTRDSDIPLIMLNGDRNLIIDLFDPATTSPKNTGSFSGRVTVYGEALIDK